ncbi:hypothetical protein Q5530_35365 [Saccharothrix sp. BKS2]|uniref:hypothetical protein n=1 Tax=Saccharothrix sp. BKS2 TaxID=3064400 RepID=UPI0039EC51D3
MRLDQETIDGTIPFRQAEAILDGLFRMMRAAATTADDPTHPHRGRRSATVTDFLEEDIRLGHTKRGSFVFTVVTRLGDPPPPGDGSPSATFPRRVMTTLAEGLEATRRLALTWDEQVLDHAGRLGLSAGLVEALAELTASEVLRALDLSFDWAVAEPPPRVRTSHIVFDRNTLAGLPRVRERLVRREEPPRRVTLVGTVRTLNRGDLDEDGEASIVLAADVNGRRRNVHIPLGGADYDVAIVAHRTKQPLVATGDLAFERNAWRLGGDVVVDAGFVDLNG